MQTIDLQNVCRKWLTYNYPHIPFLDVDVTQLDLASRDLWWITLFKHEVQEMSRNVNVDFKSAHQVPFYTLSVCPDFYPTRKVTLLHMLVKGIKGKDIISQILGKPQELTLSYMNEIPHEAKAVFGDTFSINLEKEVDSQPFPIQRFVESKTLETCQASVNIKVSENLYIGQFHCTVRLTGDVYFNCKRNRMNIGQIVKDMKRYQDRSLDAVNVIDKWNNDLNVFLPDGIEWNMYGNCELIWFSVKS